MALFVFVFVSAKTVRRKHLLLPSQENVLCWLHPSQIEGERRSWVERGGSLTCLGGLGWAGAGGGEFVTLLHFFKSAVCVLYYFSGAWGWGNLGGK